MNKITPDYYKKNAETLGWGLSNAKLDTERIELLKTYIKGKKVLDIGCGTGLYVDFYQKLGYDSWGLDHVEYFIEQAKRGKEGTFVFGQAEKLPFKENSFDTVTILDVLEHCDDIKVLVEAKKVTKKTIICIIPRKVDTGLEKSGVIFRHYLDQSHLRVYEKSDLDNLAKKIGLKVKLIKEVHPLNIKTLFINLFDGPLIIKKLMFRSLNIFLSKKEFYSEYFVVFEK